MNPPPEYSQPLSSEDAKKLAYEIKHLALQNGFQQAAFSDTTLNIAEQHLQNWLRKGFHGEMSYMQRHGLKRSRPQLLQENTLSILCVRMDYLPEDPMNLHENLQDPVAAYISRYALGRDYHKVLRKRLQKLANQIEELIGSFGYRVFVDSAPVLEKPLAEKAGIGWIGKHTNVINKNSGSWFFLGEIYLDLPITPDTPAKNHCGDCTACIDICPTKAIVAPYQLDARLCISYLTIEFSGVIPEPLRPLIGNRIYGCDDCQLVCPWNRFAQLTEEADFLPRQQLNEPQLLTVFSWTEQEFLSHTEGSAIRRIGYQRWLRNIAVALGNAPRSTQIINKLQSRLAQSSELVKEHILWAIQQQSNK